MRRSRRACHEPEQPFRSQWALNVLKSRHGKLNVMPMRDRVAVSARCASAISLSSSELCPSVPNALSSSHTR